MVRIYPNILLLSIGVLWMACSQEPPKAEVEAKDIDAVKWNSERLPIALNVSQEIKEKLSERWNPALGRLELKIEPNLEIFVVQSEYPVDAKLQDPALEIFEIDFWQKTDSLLVFGSRIPESEAVYWQFFRTFEIDGVPYYAENNPLIEYQREDVELMSEIFADIRPLNSSLAENQ